MKRNEIVDLMMWVIANNPSWQEKEIKPTVLLWERMFADVPRDKFEKALMKVLARSEYFPTVAAISKALTVESDLTPVEAWGEVQKAIRFYGYVRPEQALNSLSPLARRVADSIGWLNLCSSEEPDVLRGQFMNHYATLTQRAKDMAVLPKEVRESGMGTLSDEMKRIVSEMAGDETKLIGVGDDELPF